MWNPDDYRVHERTLLGAIDSFLKALVRLRPQQAAAYGDVLEDFATCWLERGGLNQVESVERDWLTLYLETSSDRIAAAAALGDFYEWVGREGLSPSTGPIAAGGQRAL